MTAAQCYRCGGAMGRALADAMLVDAQLHEAEALLRRLEHQLEEHDERAEHEAPAAEATREPAAEREAPAAVGRQADVLELAAQPQAAMREFGDFQMRDVASLVNARLDEPSRRWRRYLAAGLVTVTALLLPVGGYLDHRYELSPGLTISEPSPIHLSTDRRADALPVPIAALSQARDGPTASRVDAAVGEPPPTTAPAAAAAPEARCPAAVEAMALCDWAVRAERR